MEFRRVCAIVTCEKLFVILFVSAVKKITDKAILSWIGHVFPNIQAVCGIRTRATGDVFWVQYGDPGVVNVGPVKNSTGFLFAPLDLSFSARSSKNRDRTIRKVRNPTLDLFFSSPLRWMSRLRTYSRPSA
jgi:hypothetical protein